MGRLSAKTRVSISAALACLLLVPVLRLCAADEGAPASTVYYVDNSHADATDFLNAHGSADRPRVSLPSGRIPAGSRVEVRGGPYESDDTLLIEAEGTADAPVVVTGAAAGDLPIIRVPIEITGSHIVIEHLAFDRNRRTLDVVPGATNVTIRHNRFTGQPVDDGYTSVIGIYGDESAATHDIVISDNVMQLFGDRSPDSDENDYHGIKASQYCTDVSILRNTIFAMAGDSVQIGDARMAEEARCRRIHIARNTFFFNRENAIDIKKSSDVLISQNVLYGFREPESDEAIAVVIHDAADGVWIAENWIADSSLGVINTAGTDVWLIANFVTGMHPQYSDSMTDFYGDGVAAHFRGDSSGGALFNVFSDYARGIQVASGGPYVMAGNLFRRSDEYRGYDLMVQSTRLIDAISLTANDFADFRARISSENHRSPGRLQSRGGAWSADDAANTLVEFFCRNQAEAVRDVLRGRLDPALAADYRDRFGEDILRETAPTADGDGLFAIFASVASDPAVPDALIDSIGGSAASFCE